MRGSLGRMAILAGACLAAGVAAGVAGGVALVLASIAIEPNAPIDWLAGLLVMSLIMTFYATVAMCVFGLPAHVLLSRQRLTRSTHYGGAGLLAGALISALLVPLFGDLMIVVIGAVTGGVGGFVFWTIARPERHESRSVQRR